MSNRARYLGLVAVLAVPALGTWWLVSRSTPPAPPYTPEPLYAGPAADGLTFVHRVDPTQRDMRGFEHVALYVSDTEPASDFLPPGPFDATFKGVLEVPTRDDYTFTFVGTGDFRLTVDGQAVSVGTGGSVARTSGEPVRLTKGEHRFTGVYTSPTAGPSVLRLYWECRDFAREPIPSTSLRHEESAALGGYQALRRGRELVTELRCGSCHLGVPAGLGAPALAGVGTRLRREWMASWIADPKMVRQSTTMPKMLHGENSVVGARDIAAFLSLQGLTGEDRSSKPMAYGEEDRQIGGEIIADYGCVACHTLPDHRDPESAAGRIPLRGLAAKWYPAGLVRYLQDPAEFHQASRMPDYGFDEFDAEAVAAFLMGAAPESSIRAIEDVQQGDPRRGEQLFSSSGCAACHALDVPSSLEAPEAAWTSKGSVDCASADFSLAPSEVSALQSYLVRGEPGRDTSVEFAAHQIRLQRCTACHAMNGVPSVLSRVREETRDLLGPDALAGMDGPVKLPPDLTHAGAKLRSDWLVPWLRGEIEESARPWLFMTMPTFAVDAERMAVGLSHAQGYAATEGTGDWRDGGGMVPETAARGSYDPQPVPQPELEEIGRRLLGEDGFACTDCHGVGPQEAKSPFEAPGINLALAADRLRKEFFHRWMLDPTRLDPASKMTRFVDPSTGQTGRPALGGSGQAQYEAIWRYLMSLGR